MIPKEHTDSIVTAMMKQSVRNRRYHLLHAKLL